MRFISSFVALLLLQTSTVVLSLSLANFQPIVSFPTQCTNAYNTQITQCTAKDFSGGNPCSKRCIANLDAIGNIINVNCVGTRADPSTLIGLFFQGKGVSVLCPNADGGSDNIGQSTMVAVSETSVDSSVAAATSDSPAASTRSESTTTREETSSARTTSISTTTTRSSTERSSASSPAPSTTKSQSTSTGAASSTTSSASLRIGFTSTAVNNGVATVITSKSQQTANADGFGGGGSPFEVGVNGGASIPIRMIESLMVAFVVGAVMVLR